MKYDENYVYNVSSNGDISNGYWYASVDLGSLTGACCVEKSGIIGFSSERVSGSYEYRFSPDTDTDYDAYFSTPDGAGYDRFHWDGTVNEYSYGFSIIRIMITNVMWFILQVILEVADGIHTKIPTENSRAN